MKLLGPRLLVQAIEMEQTTGGIHLPDSLKGHNLGGVKLFRVLQTGPGRRLKNGSMEPILAIPGDRVLCHSYTQGPVDLGEGRLLIEEKEVLAILPYAKKD